MNDDQVKYVSNEHDQNIMDKQTMDVETAGPKNSKHTYKNSKESIGPLLDW